MTISTIYWMLLIVSLVFGFWVGRPAGPAPVNRWGYWGYNLLLFVLFVLIGLKIFGPIIRD